MARPDTEKAVAAFDVDDVFYPLNEHVANIARVDYNSIVMFNAKDNPILSHAERDRLYDAYQTPRLHETMDFYPGAEAFGVLARDLRLESWICSNSLDQIVVDDKLSNLSGFFAGDFDNFRLMMNIIAMEHSKKKKFPDNLWLLVDDGPLNAVASCARHVLMPRRPWNVSEWGLGILSPIMPRVRYHADPREACAMARALLDRDFEPLS